MKKLKKRIFQIMVFFLIGVCSMPFDTMRFFNINISAETAKEMQTGTIVPEEGEEVIEEEESAEAVEQETAVESIRALEAVLNADKYKVGKN